MTEQERALVAEIVALTLEMSAENRERFKWYAHGLIDGARPN